MLLAFLKSGTSREKKPWAFLVYMKGLLSYFVPDKDRLIGFFRKISEKSAEICQKDSWSHGQWHSVFIVWKQMCVDTH